MKKIIIAAIMLFSLNMGIQAQNVTRNGNTFTQTSSRSSHKADTLVTAYKYASNGVNYPIIINKSSGACYIWKKSRNNKMYKMYMKPEVSQAICSELNIEYKPRNRR